tara:strand:- start:2615 stop:3295 length:681 start_codon:yes stop_codon:yes gene_type:complete
MRNDTKHHLYGGIVWIISGSLLVTYGILGLTKQNIPGVEELVSFIQAAEGVYIYLAAFIAIFIEGLYFFGSFFPGSTFVLLIAILSQAGGPDTFLKVIGTIYIGWIMAGLVNMFGASLFAKKIQSVISDKIEDNTGATWFPAFRANTEVAQIIEGHSFWEVFRSSLRVKTIACIGAAVYSLVLPFIIDLTSMKNEEGFLGLSIIAAISFGVGIYKIRLHRQQKTAS